MSQTRSTRRAFLGAAVGLGALGENQAAGPQSARDSDLKRTGAYLIGCYTRPWADHELPRILDGVAEAGYAHVGLMTAKGSQPSIITPDTTESEAARIQGLARERGLRICSVYGGFSLSGSRAEGFRQLKQLITNVALCGCSELLLGGAGDAALQPAFNSVVRDACAYASEHRVGITLKPHGDPNATSAQCRAIIEEVARAEFRLWYDPGNILYYSDGKLDPLVDVMAADGLVVGMSVKDFQAPKNVQVTPGTGQVNFPALFARLRLGGFRRGLLVVECTAPGDFAAVTREARKARLLAETLARGGTRLESVHPLRDQQR